MARGALLHLVFQENGAGREGFGREGTGALLYASMESGIDGYLDERGVGPGKARRALEELRRFHDRVGPAPGE